MPQTPLVKLCFVCQMFFARNYYSQPVMGLSSPCALDFAATRLEYE